MEHPRPEQGTAHRHRLGGRKQHRLQGGELFGRAPLGGQPETWPKYANQAACPAAGNGWYYDNDAAPTKILLCPSTCSMVKNTKGQVDVLFGCATQGPS